MTHGTMHVVDEDRTNPLVLHAWHDGQAEDALELLINVVPRLMERVECDAGNQGFWPFRLDPHWRWDLHPFVGEAGFRARAGRWGLDSRRFDPVYLASLISASEDCKWMAVPGDSWLPSWERGTPPGLTVVCAADRQTYDVRIDEDHDPARCLELLATLPEETLRFIEVLDGTGVRVHYWDWMVELLWRKYEATYGGRTNDTE